MRRAAACLLAGAGFLLLGAKGSPAVPIFKPTACDLQPVSAAIAPRLRCGTVLVPRDYAHAQAGSFRLAVVIIASQTQPAEPDPVLYISGGPGSPLTKYADYQGRHPYAPGRDLILVDQRGVGRSEPKLCPDHAADILRADLAVAIAPSDEARAQRQFVITACAADMRESGISPADFGTAVTVDDFEAVRRALGLRQWNLYGESYGTTVAMTLMARFPKTVRSAVLDSLYPPDPLPRWSERVAQARGALFSLCQQDEACAAPYPDLAEQYRQALFRLRRAPLSVPSAPFYRQPSGQIALTASLFEVLVAQRLYYIETYSSLPRLIASVRAGQTASAAAAVSAMLFRAQNLTLPAYIAVECRDRPSLRQPLHAAAAALDRFQIYGVCPDWAALGPPPLVPAGTAIPTLVFAGQFDPNISPTMSRQVAERIGPHARWIEFPLQAHHVRTTSACAAAITAAFISDPRVAPDTGCIRQTEPIRFIVPDAAMAAH